jgi:hypothetical protein
VESELSFTGLLEVREIEASLDNLSRLKDENGSFDAIFSDFTEALILTKLYKFGFSITTFPF